MGLFKTREEYEREEKIKFQQRLRDEEERRLGRISSRHYKCKMVGCQQTFQDVVMLYAHIEHHNQQMRKDLICNQRKCGKKCRSLKEFNDHVEEHKVESKRKIKNSIRAVLLYNKHGLLLDALEKEFKRLHGRNIPYKFFGHDSLYDMMSSLPDVVRMIRGYGGNTLLLGVPDENTIHVARLVGNQRDNREGFNKKTSEFLARLDCETKKKISAVTGFKDRQISDLVKNQIRELLESDQAMNGIRLSDLPRFYEREFGYRIDWRDFGFRNVEDFCINGLRNDVDVDLELFDLKIVEKGLFGLTKSKVEPKKVYSRIVRNLSQMMKTVEGGVDATQFKELYEENFGDLNLLKLGFISVVEFCLFLPDVLKVSKTSEGYVISAASEEPSGCSKKVEILSEVSHNLAQLLEGHQDGVSLDQLVRGYQGYYGNLSESLTELQLEKAEDLIELCVEVCQLERGTGGDMTVRPVAPSSLQTGISGNIQQMIQSFSGPVEISLLSELCLQSYGTVGRLEGKVQTLEAGWLTVLCYSRRDMTCQQSRFRPLVTKLEEEMGKFYTSSSKVPMRVLRGGMVAALDQSLTWRRARVTEVSTDWAEVEYVDWGRVARVRRKALHLLDSR